VLGESSNQHVFHQQRHPKPLQKTHHNHNITDPANKPNPFNPRTILIPIHLTEPYTNNPKPDLPQTHNPPQKGNSYTGFLCFFLFQAQTRKVEKDPKKTNFFNKNQFFFRFPAWGAAATETLI